MGRHLTDFKLSNNMDYVKMSKISACFTIALHCLASLAAQDLGECSPRCWNPVRSNSGVQGATDQQGVKDEEECKALCVNNGACIGLDWNKNRNECWFQFGPLNSYNGQNVNHWSLANCTGDCASYCWRAVQIGFQVFGGTLKPNVSDENHCKSLCSITPNCTGVDWDSSCYLIFNQDTPRGKPGIRHWGIKRNLPTICPEPTTTAAATTTIATTITTTHITTTTPVVTTTNNPTSTESSTSASAPAAPVTLSTSSGSSPRPSNASSEFSPSLTQSYDQKNAIIGGLVGGIGGLILTVVTIVIIVLLLRRRRNNEKLREIGDDILLENDDKKNRIRPDIAPKPKLTSGPLPSTDPVSLTKLSSHFASLNTGDGFKHEFDSLPLANNDLCGASKGSDTATKKNRFKNILPYDATRVKLVIQNKGASDYINASYIQGYNGAQKTYIAAQGPLKTTLNDFWQMIWDEGLNRIVMITQLTEQGKCKCEKYWPDGVNDIKQFDKITVTLFECHVCTDYTKRVMRVEHKENNETRLVTQLHFTIWSDKGIPSEVYPVLAFRKRVRLLDRDATGPMLVHCSAGVGRTGTFIALDCLLEQSEKTKQVSVFGVAKKLREQRMTMVQVADQYKLLYKAVLEANKTGVTGIDRSSFEQHFATVNQDFPDSLKTTSEIEFSLLEEMKKLNTVDDKTSDHQHENLNKNRSRDTIPGDSVRIYLSSTSHQSDYINAVLAKGHHCPGHYILTQLPLKDTIADFWRMVTEQICPTIVVLEPPDESDELAYWPTEVGSTLQFGKILVKLSSKVTAGGILGLELHLKRSGSAAQIVHLYRLSSWAREAELPDKATDILDLLGILSDRHKKLMNLNDATAADAAEDRKPAIVVCLDGTVKSGLFVAASYLIDKMNNDCEVDAYFSCRYVLSSRPQAITSLVQYQYLFQLAAEHLRWSPTVTMDLAAAQNTDDIYANANQDSRTNQPIYDNI